MNMCRFTGRLKILIALCCLGNQSFAQDESLDPSQAYLAKRVDPVTYDVEYSIVVTAPYKTKKLAVWLPLPPNDAGQTVSGSQLTSYPAIVEPRIATEKVFGNRFAYFEFKAPQGAQVIRHTFRIQIAELRWELDPEKILTVKNWPNSFDKYRLGDSQAVVVDERFQKLLREIVPQPRGPASDLNSVMTWVKDEFQYDHNDASLKANAEHGLLKRHGHCSDYHSFCAAMGRVLGMPTRVTYGINTFPKNSPSHCKLEAFLPPYGWVSFDVSETQKLGDLIRKSTDLDEQAKISLEAAAERRLLKGFRDNTWFLQTRGTDYDLVPPAAAGRVPLVRTVYIEADGVPLPEPDPASATQQTFAWMTVLECKPDRKVIYPFADWNSLDKEKSEQK